MEQEKVKEKQDQKKNETHKILKFKSEEKKKKSKFLTYLFPIFN